MNPLAYLTITIIAVFITYRLTHMNNLKVLREKWITEVRNASSNLIEAHEKLYYASDRTYTRLLGKQELSDADRVACDEAKAHVTASSAKLRLLFKYGDNDFEELEKKIKELIESSDEPRKSNDLSIGIDTKRRDSAQEEFLKSINTLLNKHWNDISESFETKILAKTCKYCHK